MDIKLKGGIILIVLLAALYYVFPTYRAYQTGVDPQTVENKVNLGLDLQGGMYLDIEIKADDAVKEILRRTAEELEDLMIDEQVDFVEVRQTVDSLIVEMESGKKVDLKKSPYDRFLVQFDQNKQDDLTFLKLRAEEAELIRKNAVSQALEVLRNRIDSLGISEPSLQQQGENNIVIQLPGLKDRDRAIELIGPQAVLQFQLVNNNATPDSYNRISEVVKYEEVWDKTTNKLISKRPYVLEKKILMTGEFIRDARVRIDPQDNRPYVSLSFDSIGADKFAKITRRNVGRNMAIVLDDKVQSAPVIREAITGGEASISGQFTVEEADTLKIVLRSGSLPAPIEIREERTVGASLGEDSVDQGLNSLLIGSVLVLIFILVYYRLAGVFAAVALIFNIILIISVLGAFGATLTLPGMAGIVLTIGMAVDANVLIFQRIREEIKRTENPRAAIQEGFGKAFRTILDANVTTLFAALALLQFGTGPIKGFAVTLSIGIIASMFTAIVVTRFFFDFVYLRRTKLRSLSI
ncbi:MAG: Protein translocase subunit SecD [Deltaproteobacteria bacterium]|jgi:preprotein translocase subunit SecD|nr:Protein translocase subunit SecD [Deltaproteobacteria bacterium]